MKKNWVLRENVPIKNYEVHNVLETILKGRGIYDFIAKGSSFGLKKYLNPSIQYLRNPEEIPNLEDAAQEIISAVEKRKKICVFGHDDVDGITSSYILLQCLSELGSENHEYYIPNRIFDKFGLTENFINKMINENFELVITVDIGTSENDAIQILKSHNIDTIIIDHHRISNKLPAAISIVNPKINGLDFPESILAGVGVTYKVVQVINRFFRKDSIPTPSDNFSLLLTGLGTVADRVTLLDDNRIFAKYLYDNFKITDNLFFSYFIENNAESSLNEKIKKVITLLTVGRGRAGKHLGLDILLSNTLSEVKEIYENLQNKFKKNEAEIEFTIKFLEEKYLKKSTQAIFFYYDENGEVPVEYLGLGSSYIADKYNKPALILSHLNETIVNAESRGPEDFDWIKCFQKIKKNLIQFGGHKRAAGFTCIPNQVMKIEKKIEQISTEYQPNINAGEKVMIDYCVEKNEINPEFFYEIFSKMSPYGEKNFAPKFLLKNISISDLESIKCGNLPERTDYLFDAVVSISNSMDFSEGTRIEKIVKLVDCDCGYSD
ncbi:MAG: DHH family phosphoesterase [Candidatus Cloacimonadota bacterium]|nr:DHH family phosphoesterase [Candidatus Cloacimonadota bacterium]